MAHRRSGCLLGALSHTPTGFHSARFLHRLGLRNWPVRVRNLLDRREFLRRCRTFRRAGDPGRRGVVSGPSHFPGHGCGALCRHRAAQTPRGHCRKSASRNLLGGDGMVARSCPDRFSVEPGRLCSGRSRRAATAGSLGRKLRVELSHRPCRRHARSCVFRRATSTVSRSRVVRDGHHRTLGCRYVPPWIRGALASRRPAHRARQRAATGEMGARKPGRDP